MKIIIGDITEITEGIIVHQTNAWGIMGAGLAKQIKDKFPIAFDSYRKHVSAFCAAGERSALLGTNQIVGVKPGLCVCNAFTQIPGDGVLRRGEVTDLKSITKVFTNLAGTGLQVYVPYNYGCGIASGNWGDVSRTILEACPSVIFVKLPE